MSGDAYEDLERRRAKMMGERPTSESTEKAPAVKQEAPPLRTAEEDHEQNVRTRTKTEGFAAETMCRRAQIMAGQSTPVATGAQDQSPVNGAKPKTKQKST